MDVTVERFVNTYSRYFGKQEVTFNSNQVTDVVPAADSPWIDEPLVAIRFVDQPSITVSRKEFFNTLKNL